MQIAILSDSHSNLRNIQRAIDMFRDRAVTTVLHCGDIADPNAVLAFEGFEAYFVFGNVDYDRRPLREAIGELGATCCETFGELELAGRRIALLHGDDKRRLLAEEASGRHDLLCYGHTHQAEWHTTGNTLVLNPGALHRARPHTFALYDTDAHRVEILPL
jgi:putative phosphoesterase